MPKAQTVVKVLQVHAAAQQRKVDEFRGKRKLAKRRTVEALLVMDDVVGFGIQPKHTVRTGAYW